jgi:hypothetical protein
MGQHRDPGSCGDLFQQLLGGHAFTEKWDLSPNQNMDRVRRITVFDSRQNKQFRGAYVGTSLAMLDSAFLGEATIMLSHHQNPETPPRKFSR